MCIKVCHSCCDLCYWLCFSPICLVWLFFFPQPSILSQSEENDDIGPEMADEFMHPHTQWVLKQPVAKYVLDPHPVYLKHGRPTASSGAAAASGSPSGQSGDASGQGTNTEADTASQHEASPDTFTPRIPPSAFGAAVHQVQFQQPHFTNAKIHRHDAEPVQAADPNRIDQVGGESAMPALSGFSASQPMETPAGSEPYTPAGMHCCVAPLASYQADLDTSHAWCASLAASNCIHALAACNQSLFKVCFECISALVMTNSDPHKLCQLQLQVVLHCGC